MGFSGDDWVETHEMVYLFRVRSMFHNAPKQRYKTIAALSFEAKYIGKDELRVRREIFFSLITARAT